MKKNTLMIYKEDGLRAVNLQATQHYYIDL